MSLQATAARIAKAYVGVKETSPNSGPEVDEFLRSVGLPPGQPWCSSFLFWVFSKAAGELGLVNPYPRTGSSQRVWRMSEPICRESNPQLGDVYVLRHDENTGHVGIITNVDDIGNIEEVSGNTFAKGGGRAGNCVAMHRGQPEVTHGGELLGFLRFDRAAQQPPGFES